MRMLSDNMLWMRQLESLSRTSGIIHVADPHEEIKFTHTPIHYKKRSPWSHGTKSVRLIVS